MSTSATRLLPVLSAGEQYPQDAVPQFDTVGGSINATATSNLHQQGYTGNGVVVVVVDTGVDGSQFAEERKLEGRDLTPDGDDPWDPYHPHGTMSAGIAAGGPETGGADPGYAPSAEVFPIKSTLSSTEIVQAQDEIADLAERRDAPIVVNNSWGFVDCSGVCDHPVTEAVRSTSKLDNVYQIFAAGNQGTKCGLGCGETGISGPNSINEGITVAATGRDGDPTSLHPYSSRGGRKASCGSRKPDVAAPTFGIVPWGDSRRNIGNGGGTSAAAPQVAGAIACLLSKADGTPPAEAVFETIRGTAQPADGTGWNGCYGHGNLNAAQAATAGFSPSIVGAGFDKGLAAVLGAGIGGALLASRYRDL